MTLGSRLLALEKRAASATGLAETPLAGLVSDPAWRVMRQTMSEEHARIVEEAYEQGRWVIYNTPQGRLLNRCLEAISRPAGRWDSHWAYKGVRPEVALAMPPEVAQVYLDHPDAVTLDDCCADCGYRVPIKYFQSCPFCAGKVGWYAFWKKQGKHADEIALPVHSGRT